MNDTGHVRKLSDLWKSVDRGDVLSDAELATVIVQIRTGIQFLEDRGEHGGVLFKARLDYARLQEFARERADKTVRPGTAIKGGARLKGEYGARLNEAITRLQHAAGEPGEGFFERVMAPSPPQTLADALHRIEPTDWTDGDFSEWSCESGDDEPVFWRVVEHGGASYTLHFTQGWYEQTGDAKSLRELVTLATAFRISADSVNTTLDASAC